MRTKERQSWRRLEWEPWLQLGKKHGAASSLIRKRIAQLPTPHRQVPVRASAQTGSSAAAPGGLWHESQPLLREKEERRVLVSARAGAWSQIYARCSRWWARDGAGPVSDAHLALWNPRRICEPPPVSTRSTCTWRSSCREETCSRTHTWLARCDQRYDGRVAATRGCILWLSICQLQILGQPRPPERVVGRQRIL